MATTHLKKPKANMTPNDWLAVLAQASKQIADEVPEGFKTVAQIAKETGKSNSQTAKYLREAVNLGLVEDAKFKVATGNKIYPVPHFRILPCNSQKRSA
jgi:predicted transcriptional regulator